MKFGVREVCDIDFYRYKDNSKTPAFTIESAKMSTLESATTTVYAQGGRGNSRLAAWEGERTLTFTIEDALITTETLEALLGNAPTSASKELRSGISKQCKKYSITTVNFAGYYSIQAQTLFRDIDTGSDYAAIIEIHKAKLQSTINISMAPTGDPSTFTFTFDAFPKGGSSDDKNILCDIYIAETDGEGEASTETRSTTVTIINGTTAATITADINTGTELTCKPITNGDTTTYTVYLGETAATDSALTALTAKKKFSDGENAFDSVTIYPDKDRIFKLVD